MKLPCPLQSRLDSFLAGQLDLADEAVIEQHVDHCASCQKRLEELTADSIQPPRLAAVGNLVEEPLTPRLRQNMAQAYSAELATFNGTISGERTKPDSIRPAEDWPLIPGYEVENLLGRGGLGVVYRAKDLKLKRSVALKIIRQQASPEERERLQREAEALATLRHPGVVQIHEIGEYNGRPFLALEYVAGGSLSRFTAGKPQSPRAVARLVASLAETIHMAHQHGLVHRDLKPANILLQWENQSRIHDDLAYCQAKITDFGLVKNMAIDSGLTHTRDLLGTPNYMAPEQAGGEPETVGPACDIWALGAMLYELLTGRPPFHGATAVDTLMLVRQSEPVPPCRLQPKLSRDLETICLKCLEKSPSHRYGTAQELADDLNRFREGQPIHARPISLAGRTWRWCRRNPAIAGLSGFAALLLMTLAIGGPIAAYRQSELKKEATARAQQAEAERKRAGQNLDLATLALEETLKQVYERIGLRPDTLRDFDQNAWEATIPYLEQLVNQEANTPELRLQKARATRQLARSLADRGQRDQARTSFQQSIREMTDLYAADQGRDNIRRDLAVCHSEFGKFLLAGKETVDEGEKQLEVAIDHFEALVMAKPRDGINREALANCIALVGGRMMQSPGRRPTARDHLFRAAELQHELATEFPEKRAFQFSELFTRMSLAIVQSELSEDANSLASFGAAFRIARSLSVAAPADSQLLYLQSAALNGMAVVHKKAGRLEDAKACALESTDICHRLAMAFPAARQFAQAAIQSHELCRWVLVQQRDWPAAAEQATAALAILNAYRAAHPSDPSSRVDEFAITRHLAEATRNMGRHEEAAELYRAAIAIGDQLIDGKYALDPAMRRSHAESKIELGELQKSGGDAAAAAQSFEQSITLLTSPDSQPTHRETRKLLKRALQHWGEALAALGRSDEAQVAKSRAGQIKDQDQ